MSDQIFGFQPGRSSGVVDSTGILSLINSIIERSRSGYIFTSLTFHVFKFSKKGTSSDVLLITVSEVSHINAVFFQPFTGGGSGNVGVISIKENKIEAIMQLGFEAPEKAEVGAFLLTFAN
jgi:hypothetical protein